MMRENTPVFSPFGDPPGGNEANENGFERGLIELLPRLRGYAMSLARDIARAEDLVQETYLKALSNRNSFEIGTNLQAWAFTILRNTFLSERRKVNRETAGEEGENIIANTIGAANQETALESKAVLEELQTLPQKQRDSIILVTIRGYSYEEASEQLGIPVGTVKSAINRARAKLRKAIETGTGRQAPDAPALLAPIDAVADKTKFPA